MQDQVVGPQIDWIREMVDSGRYSVSEHIIRFFISQKLDMAEIVASLESGMVVEWRCNVKKRYGSLVRGKAGDKTLSLLCERADDDTLVMLLAYLNPSPQWQQRQEVESNGGDFMREKKRVCFFCGGDIKPIVVGNFDYRLEGDLFVVKNVPAGLCVECGEKYIESDVAHSINARVSSGEFSGTDTVRVIDFEGD